MTWSIAVDAKMPVHLYRRERAAVQAKTMTFLSRGEAVIKDAGHVLGSDPFALILHAEAQRCVIDNLDAQRHMALTVADLGHCIFGIADQVDQDQQQAVFVADDCRCVLVVLGDDDMVPTQGAGIHAQRILEQIDDVQRLDQPGRAGIGLLSGNDVLDVIDAFGEL